MKHKQDIAHSNNEMLRSNIKEVKHHADELSRIVNDKTEVEGWVVAKAERSASDLSDVTHYLDGKFAKGGNVKMVKDTNKYQSSWGRTTDAIGEFDIKYGNRWWYGTLFPISDFDKQYWQNVPLKANEKLFRYSTYNTKVAGMQPVVKINTEKGIIYFLKDMNSDDDKNLDFETRGIKLKLLQLNEDAMKTYREGGTTDTSMYRYPPTTDAEDLLEAREYVGEKKWKSMTRQERMDATKYLKAQGRIGYFGQEEDIETLASMQYAKGGKLIGNQYRLDKNKNRILDEEDFRIIRGEKYDDGGQTEDMGVQFIDYKDKEIMFEPHYKKYYTNDVEFDSLDKAKKYIDNGSKSPSWERAAYRSGIMADGGMTGGLDSLSKKIRKASKSIYDDSESNVVYLSSDNKVSIGDYKNLTPYSAQAGNEIKVSFNAPNSTMLTFSNKVKDRFEDRKSFEKYGGVIYIFEPLTEEISSEILSKVDTLKKYADGGNIEVGDRINSKTIKGKVYESSGTMFKLEDEYGNKSTKWHSTKDFKKSEIKKKYGRGGGTEDDLSEISRDDLSGTYTPSGDNYEIKIIFKELEKDGGRKYTDRFYINADSVEQAKKIAERMWREDHTDETDLSIVSITLENEEDVEMMKTYAKKVKEWSKVSKDDVYPGAKFKNPYGTVFIVDKVYENPIFGIAVETSLEGGKKGDYRDRIEDFIDFMNEEKVVKI